MGITVEAAQAKEISLPDVVCESTGNRESHPYPFIVAGCNGDPALLKILDETAKKYDAEVELKWANEFIANDYISAFERAREYLNKVIGRLDKEKRLGYLDMVWKANNQKRYITEMEATAMLKLAKDWEIESELIEMVKK